MHAENDTGASHGQVHASSSETGCVRRRRCRSARRSGIVLRRDRRSLARAGRSSPGRLRDFVRTEISRQASSRSPRLWVFSI